MMRQFTLAMAVMAMMGAHAQTITAPDTVRVINNPSQVVITEKDGEVTLNVMGDGQNKDYNYQYRIKHGDNDLVSTTQREGHDLEFNFPFKKGNDSVDNKKPHAQLFTSDIYIGWGGHSIGPGLNGIVAGGHREFGVLNFLSVGYVFNRNRTRLSLGSGIGYSTYSLKNRYFWERTDEGILGIYSIDGVDYDKHSATLSVVNIQFPLMFNQSLGRKWDVAVAGVMNWNCYASVNNSYRIDHDNHHISINGLHQRKISFDALGMISFRGIAAYVRYSPQSLFKGGCGPELKNRWTIGLSIRGRFW